jgi:hypothetical protein
MQINVRKMYISIFRNEFCSKIILTGMKWEMGMQVVVFYDDGMAVDDDFEKLHLHASIMHSDLINAGLVPGVGKCIWSPVQAVDWNGLSFNLKKGA